ncbi:MAG: hypothetical protein M1828_004312 [Chrysothrix sp. TS-e1954]|nr:MAG: hypothetical protein M1828_004312 [Chrysothrix sp. TS-e1954]
MEESARPTVADIHGDNHFAQVAQANWLAVSRPVTRASQSLLKDDLWDPLEKDDFPTSALLLLEQLQILERFLWPSFNEDASNIHILLLALIIATKRKEALPTWTFFSDRPTDFTVFFRRIQSMLLDQGLQPRIRTQLLVTITAAFQSLDNGLVRKECAPLVSISIWHNLHDEDSRNDMLGRCPQFKKAWRTATKRFDAADDSSKVRLRFERAWLYSLSLDFIDIIHAPARRSSDHRTYCERFLELLCDLQSQFPTRRYVNTLLKDLNMLVVIRESPTYQEDKNGLIRDLTLLLQQYTFFPIDDHTGHQQSQEDIAKQRSDQKSVLQRVALKHLKEKLNLLCLANYGSLDNHNELRSHLDSLNDVEMASFADALGFRTTYPNSIALKSTRSFLLEVLLFAYEKRQSFRDSIQELDILPTEQALYETSFQRSEHYDGSRPLAIPKLNLQYLTNDDFLWRSFILLRCEAFYGIKKDLEETVKRLQPRKDSSGPNTRFTGSSRMALAISKPAIIEVVQPLVGEEIPSEVKAELVIDVSRVSDSLRKEWDSLRPSDVVFLLNVPPQDKTKRLTNGVSSQDSTDEASFKYLRTAEVLQVMDDNGRTIRAQHDQANGYPSHVRRRRLLVKLDPKAYQRDSEAGMSTIYESLNVVIRRRSRENNFKPVLESIRTLTLSDVPIPSWFQDVFLGLGDPASAGFEHLSNALESLDFRDTFLDWQHIVQSFPSQKIFADSKESAIDRPPYVLEKVKGIGDISESVSTKRRRHDDASTSVTSSQHLNGNPKGDQPAQKIASTSSYSRKRRREDTEGGSNADTVKVSSYKPPNTGPYLANISKVNSVRFTPAQIRAIESGTQVGLTVVVGPPGTGKTDVATQIINNIYHNFPSERILLIAHSNQALNQLFQKIVALDIDERHLLRLGHGEGELQLETETSYSKFGRVESFLEKGSYLLSEVNRLATSLDVPGAHGSSCETAEYFNAVHIVPMWTRFWTYADLDNTTDPAAIVASFPFHAFFSTAPQPLFPPNATKGDVLDIASGCNHHLSHLFSQLASIRPFEVLRHNRDKANYLLTSSARIIAMTATHAAIRSQEIVKLGFRYENVIMEEAAQISEIETFIPLSLQEAVEGELPLKRIVLCGDHLQNSPVIQSQALRQYAGLDQSLFARLIRLGVPAIHLDAQGRARPTLSRLYAWRYDTPASSLRNLPFVGASPEYQAANPGLRFEYQFVDVPDYKGRGESTPSPHFVQNLGEAEYAVALYQYMRLLGYPAKSISILTTYAGQRALIRDVLTHRCRVNPLFGLPRAVVTVDKYQGEQSDYIILSLVRTRSVGYLRDVRRLTVALSRARLGLYILGRREVFEACLEMRPAFEILMKRPDTLKLVTGETYPTARRISDSDTEIANEVEMTGVEHLGQYVFEMTKAKVEALKREGGSLPQSSTLDEVGTMHVDDEELDEEEIHGGTEMQNGDGSDDGVDGIDGTEEDEGGRE